VRKKSSLFLQAGNFLDEDWAVVKIGFDLRMVDNSGIGSTIRGFLNNLKEDQFKQLVLLTPPHWRNPYPCQSIEVPYGIYSLGQHFFYSHFLKKQRFSLFHMPHFDVPFFYSHPFIATVHDLIHVLFPEYSTKRLTKIYSSILLKKISRRAKKIIVVSENTKEDLINFSPESEPKIEVVPPGVDGRFFRPADEKITDVLIKYNLKPGYLLYVGNLRKSKNTEGLLKSYKILKSQWVHCPPLVLVGRNFLKRTLGFPPDGVKILGEVLEADLPALYAGAGIFVFPSFYEGFGLPPLEAMACGVPVLVSNRASLPEVCGEAAEYMDPTDIPQMAGKMESLLKSEDRRKKMSEAGLANVKRFTWEESAKRIWKIYEEVALN